MLRRLAMAAATLVAAALAAAPLASAGQIVYVHNLNPSGTGGDLGVMNDDGSGQRSLITQAQAGATSLSQPNLSPTSDSLAFEGETQAPDGTCDTNCISVLTLVGPVTWR
jgi:hypothetical protein